MKRPLLVWLVFAACAVVGGTVLAWFTREMLRLERESAEARRFAAVEENIRLALWRMDSALASVHGLEAARPPEAYEPFFHAEAAYSGAFAPLAPGAVLLPSPLLGYTPPLVKLHFQIEPDATLRSPQVPPPELRPAALAAGAVAEQIDLAARTLEELRIRLRATDLAAELAPLPAASQTSRDRLATDFPAEAERRSHDELPEVDLGHVLSAPAADAATRSSLPPAAPAPSPAVAFATTAEAPAEQLRVQQMKSEAEQFRRSSTVGLSNRYAAESSSSRLRGPGPGSASFKEAMRTPTGAFTEPQTDNVARPDGDEATFAFGGRAAASPQRAGTTTASAAQPAAAGRERVAAGEHDRGPASATTRSRAASSAREQPAAAQVPAVAKPVERERRIGTVAAVAAAEADTATDEAQSVAKSKTPGDDDSGEADATAETVTSMPDNAAGPLQAMWVGEELVFARRAIVAGRNVVQGAWLDWPEVRTWLLARVTDLLPEATLQPARNGEGTGTLNADRRLAFLPVQLVPGAAPAAGTPASPPLRLSLAIAWAGAAIGLAALALLLHGTVRLSERRGAFVSAVTHELRTPLTTFRMYTEMLASGMVRDEARRQEYVGTLHRESGRLSHLVENVLSYARLERGRAAARVEDTTPGELLARCEERLRQRAQQGGMHVEVELAEDVANLPLRTDTSAVEQVLFNLVDNATKYGRPKPAAVDANTEAASSSAERQHNGVITIAVARSGPRRLAIRVADAGPGLTATARRRLFRPFSKSATEAAHSQPGVGLGLALSRRLARDELHGDLVLERTGANGTVFRLELPLA